MNLEDAPAYTHLSYWKSSKKGSYPKNCQQTNELVIVNFSKTSNDGKRIFAFNRSFIDYWTEDEEEWIDSVETGAISGRDDIADLLEIAKDIIETRGSFNIEGVKKWLPAYSNYADLKETLHPLILDSVIDNAIKNANN